MNMIQMKANFGNRMALAVLLTILLTFISPVATHAQDDETLGAPTILSAYPRDDLRFEHLTSEDGLSSNRVLSVLRDNRGFMWFGTTDGLNRYDGNELQVFKHKNEDQNSLSTNRVDVIFEDQDGMLWLGTRGGGVNRYDPRTERFTRYSHDPEDPRSLGGNTVLAIYQDQYGTLWVGTASGGLNRYDPQIDGFVRYQHDPGDPQSLSHNTTRAIIEDAAGVMWIGTDGGLNRFDRQEERFTAYRHNPDDPNSLGHDSVTAVYQDSEGVYWLCTWGGGLDRLEFEKKDGEVARFTHYRNDPDDPSSLSHNDLLDIYEDKTGGLWIGTDGGGLNRFDRRTEQFSRFRTNPHDPYSLSHDSVTSIFGDPTGLLWLGTRGGVNVLDLESKAFGHYYSIPGDTSTLNSNDVMGIYEDSEGVLWVGTGSGGLNKFDLQTQQVTYYQYDPDEPESITDNMVREIVQDRHGMLWLPTRRGLNRFDPSTGEATAYLHDPDDPSSLMDSNAYTVYQAEDGAIWVGTRAGPNRLDPLTGEISAYHQYSELEDVVDVPVASIDEDATGVLWMGTAGGGLIRFDPQVEQFTQYRLNADDPDSLADNFVYDVYFDRAGSLWIGTAAGLDRFDGDTGGFIHYGEKDGLPSAGVMSILQDDLPAEAGGPYLWISTTQGLTRFNPGSGDVRTYDFSDGLQGDDFVWSSAFKNQHGDLFFGGTNGLTVFDPSQILDNPHIPPVVITDFQLAGKSADISDDSILRQAIHLTDHLVLSYEDRVVSFEFAALNYRAPEKNRYRYRLEGFEEGWTEVGSDRRFATYTNLDPGEYTFRVLGSNSDGVWNEQGTSLGITITPPWWATTWFRALVLLLLVGTALGAYRWRVKSLESRSLELETLVAEQTRQLEYRVKELDTLLAVSQQVTSTLDLESLLSLILDHLKQVVDYDVGTIRRLVRENLKLQAHRWFFPQSGQPSQRLPVADIPIIREVVQTRQAILVADHQFKPAVVGDPEFYGGRLTGDVLQASRTLMCVPLVVKDEAIGILVLGHHQPDHWGEEEKELVQAFANQAAVAIANAELFEKAGETATLEERTRLARELHDSATQSLYSATLFSEAGQELAAAGDLESTQHYLSRVSEVIHQALKDMRLLVYELRPPVLEKEGLAGALQRRLDAVEKRAGMEARLISDELPPLPDRVVDGLYRIAQEALNNVLKHAEADAVTVTIRSEGETVTLEVLDDGQGFDPEAARDGGGMGLVGMEERAAQLGGLLSIDSIPHQGTKVKATVATHASPQEHTEILP
jgi:signal transduction histidine kinase/ligand-binding sensor domain-containing protein